MPSSVGCLLTSFRVYHAHETTAVDPFAVALLCGDVRADVSLLGQNCPNSSPATAAMKGFGKAADTPPIDVRGRSRPRRKPSSLCPPGLEDHACAQGPSDPSQRAAHTVLQAARQVAHPAAGTLAGSVAKDLLFGYQQGKREEHPHHEGIKQSRAVDGQERERDLC